jgi:ADP-ribose pyrophosphatase
MDTWPLFNSWITKQSKTTKFGFFKILSKTVTCEHHDLNAVFDVMECNDWVNVIAFTEKNKILVVKQFRLGISEFTYELPGGIIASGVHPLNAAKEELLEETGHESESWFSLGKYYPNPALQNNKVFAYACFNAKPSSSNAAHEKMISHESVSYSIFADMQSGDGLSQALVLSSLFKLKLMIEQLPKEHQTEAKKLSEIIGI